jgi:hypothetical protein
VTRKQRQAHLARLRSPMQTRKTSLYFVAKFAVLTVVLVVVRIGLGALAGQPALDLGTLIWAPSVAAALVALDIYRNRKRSR